MSRSIFVSFVFEDRSFFDRVAAWCSEKRLGADTVVIGETSDVRQQGESAIQNHLKPRIQGSSAVLLLVGRDTHNHDWVRYELSVAASARKSIVVARIPGTFGPAPEGFRELPEVAFDPVALNRALAWPELG